MADLIYNPLLKKGFQYNDGGGGDTEQKVTKFFAYEDNIEPGQIAQYQGPDDVAHGLKYGNFYQVNQVTTKTIPAGDYWLDTSNGNHYYITKIYTQEEAEAFNRSIPLYGYTGSDGANYSCPLMYYFNKSEVDNFTTNGALCVNQTTHIGYKIKSINYTQISSGLVQIASCTLENNVVLTITENYGTSAKVYGEFTCVETDEIRYSSITTINNEPSFICSADDVFNMAGTYRLFPTRPIGTNFAGSKQHTNEPLIITIGDKFTQTDTQPRTPGVTVVDGVLQISLPVEFSGNITVHGSEVIVTTEQIQSEKDFIKLRHNNPLALASGETSGIRVNNYDGNNSDCLLAVDKDGWARIGDSSGTLQKLATIEETPTAGAFMKYNETDKELESTTDGSNLTATFTPNNEALKQNIISGVSLAKIAQYINSFVFYDFQGSSTYLLFADATEQYVVTPPDGRVGFVGVLVTVRNTGNVTEDTTTNIVATVYSTSQYSFSYTANNNVAIPALVSYNNRYYCAIKFTIKSSKNIFFIGVRQGAWLQTGIDTDTVTEVILGNVFS